MREMKDSGIAWIGEIPVNWGFSKIENLYTLRNTKVSDRDYPPLSVTNKGILPQLETAAKSNAHDDRKLLCIGDFAINSRSDRRGSCGISKYNGSVSLINIILRPITEMNPRYYDWLFHTIQFGDEFYKWGHGIVDDLWTTNWQDMKKITIPIPPFSEQQAISAYLDKKCSEIDSLTADIQKQIETLEEYKRSVITEAVTKGLNPDAEMKDSGIEWVEKMPEHWNVLKIKWLLYERNERSVYGDEEPLSMSQKLGIVPTNQMDIIPNMASSFVGAKITHINDLVFNKLKAHLGVFSVSKYHGLVSHDYSVYYSSGKSNVKYLEFLFKTNNCIAEFKKRSTGVGAGLTRLYTSDLYSIKIPVPPLEEQQQIADYLDQKCTQIDGIISDKKKQLETLEEYKKSLIFEYVTGKKEVY